MNPLTLRARDIPRCGVDLSPLTPTALAGKSVAQIARLRVACGRRRHALGSLFELSGEDTATLHLRGADARMHGVGKGMRSGMIEVWGNIGDELGRGLAGGHIRVRGSAGRYAGAGMRAGHIEITGDAGDFLAAGWPGQPQGMRGGTIRVRGNVGMRAGDAMRRGLVVIEGDCGAGCGARMIAGTIIVLGASGPGLGNAMRRGTIVLCTDRPMRPASFNDSGRVEIGYLRLLMRYAARVSPKLKAYRETQHPAQRWVGDMGTLGKGEVLLLG